MRTNRTPKTALRGVHKSEHSLVISRAIFAAPYAVLQPDSGDSGSPVPIPERSKGGEPIDQAIALDEAASAPGFLALECALTISFFMNSTDDVGVGGGLFFDDEVSFRKRSMVDGVATKCGHHPHDKRHGYSKPLMYSGRSIHSGRRC